MGCFFLSLFLVEYIFRLMKKISEPLSGSRVPVLGMEWMGSLRNLCPITAGTMEHTVVRALSGWDGL